MAARDERLLLQETSFIKVGNLKFQVLTIGNKRSQPAHYQEEIGKEIIDIGVEDEPFESLQSKSVLFAKK